MKIGVVDLHAIVEVDLHLFSGQRVKLGLNPVTGEPSVSFDSMVQLQADSNPEVLTLVENLHREKSLVVFLDEFQDVLKIEENPKGVLAQFRGTIQHQTEIPYLLASSIRNRINEIFNHPDSPVCFYRPSSFWTRSSTFCLLLLLPHELSVWEIEGRFPHSG